MNFFKYICSFLLCFTSFKSLYAQNGNFFSDSLKEHIVGYGLRKSTSKLFTCFDKTIYVNNENVWFASYFLDYAAKKEKPTILSVLLVDDSCRSIATEAKFKMTGGMAFGHVLIPDAIPAGDYSFIIYTNVLTNGAPQDIFIQPITIKDAADSSFYASLKTVDTVKNAANGNTQIALKVETANHLPVAGATVTWIIGDIQDQNFGGVVKTNQDGKYVFSIPEKQIIKGKNILNVNVSYRNGVKNVQTILPLNEKKINIKFYPEGGYLVNGIESTVGWEAKNADGVPIRVSGVLYKNNQVVDTVETDSYGMGKFKITPEMTDTYEIKLIRRMIDSAFLLPQIKEKGLVINVNEAILNDSLILKLESKLPQKYFLIVHNFKQVWYSFPVQVGASGQKVLINLENIPKGLCTITVLDSLLRPCAERIFFAHYKRKYAINVTTDKPAYNTRQKVQLKIRLDENGGDSIKGIVTIACVQNSRIELKKSNDIESYIYLKNELETLPLKENYMGQSADDKDYLEKALLIKGWRKYKWLEMVRDKGDTILPNQRKITFNGMVSLYGKPLRKGVNMLVMTDSTTNIVNTDAKGKFELDGKNIMTGEGRKIHLLLNYNKNDGYTIKMANLFDNINEQLIKNFKPINYNLSPGKTTYDESQTFLGFGHVINLKEVKIRGKKDELYSEEQSLVSFAKGANQCGDYVCVYNILNCVNHQRDANNVPPEVGHTYRTSNGGSVMYNGCTTIPGGSSVTSDTFSGLNYSKEFYGSDYAQFNPPGPEYLSTIYWKQFCNVSAKDTEVSFYTSDITGPFDVIVQGVSSSGLIYKKIEFTVKKQQ